MQARAEAHVRHLGPPRSVQQHVVRLHGMEDTASAQHEAGHGQQGVGIVSQLAARWLNTSSQSQNLHEGRA